LNDGRMHELASARNLPCDALRHMSTGRYSICLSCACSCDY
jgi:hypothetical protein